MSKYFTEVFHELVPQGHGQLVMKKLNEDVIIIIINCCFLVFLFLGFNGN